MNDISCFPPDAQEILLFMRDYKFLGSAYIGNNETCEIVTNIKIALEMYTNQDIGRPYFFLQDVFSSAQRNIDIPPSSNFLEKFAIHRDSFNYFEVMKSNNQHLMHELNLTEDDHAFLINIFYEDLIFCAKSRIFSGRKIDFFEKLFEIYQSSGFPCGWKGSSSPRKGNFVIFSK